MDCFCRHTKLLDTFLYTKRKNKMSEDHSKHQFDKGMQFCEKGDYFNAISFFKDALLEKPQYVEALYNLACCLAATGSRKEALTYLSRACKLSINCIDWAKEDKEFESCHSDPVYKKIVYGETANEPERETESQSPPLPGEEHAVIETSKGIIRLELFSEAAPLTIVNFANLSLREFYNHLTFHRVIPNFMIQGGCPLGTGTGGPGYKFEDEFSLQYTHDRPGILSMANSGENTNGSQFFITHKPTPWLDQKHTVFGKVMGNEDQETVNRIEMGDRIHRIHIRLDTSELFERYQSKLKQWNQVLNKKFPNLRHL